MDVVRMKGRVFGGAEAPLQTLTLVIWRLPVAVPGGLPRAAPPSPGTGAQPQCPALSPHKATGDDAGNQQPTREANGNQKFLLGPFTTSQGRLALPQAACNPFYRIQQGLGVASDSHSPATTCFGERSRGLSEHNYLYAMLHISSLLCTSSRSLPGCSSTR